MPKLRDTAFFARAIPAIVADLARFPSFARQCPPFPDEPCPVPENFFGVCVAPLDDPGGDDYILERLDDLGTRQARLDFAPESFGGPIERLLRRLISHPCDICLHIAPSFQDAAAMHDAKAQANWRAFLSRTMDAFGSHVESFEIGSTVNRRSWSGIGVSRFIKAWGIAFEEARARRISLAAPNVTDFEPVYNIALLHAMRRAACVPDVHTTNLFVERATEPEAYDHKVLGRRLARLGRFTLVRKARFLQRIGEKAGAPVFHCSHVSWSLRRIARFLPDIEQKQADYLARYCLLAAASGAFGRVYWGPLIGQREGLVNDGTSEFPAIPHVTFYGRAFGRVNDFTIRPAFRAFQTVNRLLKGASFLRRHSNSPQLHILEFETHNGGRLHAAWTLNGRAAATTSCYDTASLIDAKCINRDGMEIPLPPMITETPFYLLWPRAGPASVKLNADIEHGFACHVHGKHRIMPFAIGDWKGFGVKPAPDTALPPTLLRLCHNRGGATLRESRNTVWRVPAPWDSSLELVIKRFRPRRGLRLLLQAGKLNRARRSWNGAQELLRRGLPTPAPLAFFEQTRKPALSECFYLCEAFEGFSARDAFTAFSKGEHNFQGIAQGNFYEQITQFLLLVHSRGVFFRDLSAGNLLMRVKQDSKIEFSMIDTTRAKFFHRPLGMWLRLLDLMRLCHPLHKAGRKALLQRYLAGLSRARRWWMMLPFAYYDSKHRIKNSIKRFRK